MKPQRKKDRRIEKGRANTAPAAGPTKEAAATNQKQAQEIERLLAEVSTRDEKIRQDAELIVRVRTAERERDEFRELLRVETELRIKALNRKAPKDKKLAGRIRDLEAALLGAQKDAAAKPSSVKADVVRELQQSRKDLRMAGSKLRHQMQTVAGERDAAKLERDGAVASERRMAGIAAGLRAKIEAQADEEKLTAAAVPEGDSGSGGTDGAK